MSAFAYLVLYNTSPKLMEGYENLVSYTAVLYGILEMTQVTNMTVLIGRVLKNKIDPNQGMIQPATLTILSLAVVCLSTTLFLLYACVELSQLYMRALLTLLVIVIFIVFII